MESWRQELYTSELYHHGILGQKWGVRRYQNKDGTWTREGKQRYGNDNTESSQLDRIKDAAKGLNNKRIGYSDAIKSIAEKVKPTEEVLNRINKINLQIDEANGYHKASVDAAREDIDNYYKNKQNRDSLLNDLYDMFGDGADDEEYFLLEQASVIGWEVDRSSKFNDSYEKAQSVYEQVSDEMLKGIDEVVGGMDDVPIATLHSLYGGKYEVSASQVMHRVFQNNINDILGDTSPRDVYENVAFKNPPISMDEYNAFASGKRT